MIELVPASKLQSGDVFSTDGYRVEAAVLLQSAGLADEVAVMVVGPDGHQKFAYLAPNQECPIYRAEVQA